MTISPGETVILNKVWDMGKVEKMVALLLLVFTIGLLVGEELRDLLYDDCK